ncbi:hypothetical protein HaLaN_18796 [Haematococcus lacustris]|uniref:Uncharacterized protein n=1 Tax=Haematococcus lacustris TaxID=44745 RepID=A0A699ZZA5_HAELA|nr:hypothetical protein HaLaN_18796 [Haematococcus lacustris]
MGQEYQQRYKLVNDRLPKQPTVQHHQAVTVAVAASTTEAKTT